MFFNENSLPILGIFAEEGKRFPAVGKYVREMPFEKGIAFCRNILYDIS